MRTPLGGLCVLAREDHPQRRPPPRNPPPPPQPPPPQLRPPPLPGTVATAASMRSAAGTQNAPKQPAYLSPQGWVLPRSSLQDGGADHWPHPGWSTGDSPDESGCCADALGCPWVPARSLISAMTHVPRFASEFASIWAGAVPNCTARSRQSWEGSAMATAAVPMTQARLIGRQSVVRSTLHTPRPPSVTSAFPPVSLALRSSATHYGMLETAVPEGSAAMAASKLPPGARCRLMRLASRARGSCVSIPREPVTPSLSSWGIPPRREARRNLRAGRTDGTICPERVGSSEGGGNPPRTIRCVTSAGSA